MLRDKKVSGVFLLLFMYWLGLNYLVFFSPIKFFSVTNIKAIDKIQYIVSSATQHQNLPKKNWRTIQLPDIWYKNHQNVSQIWYRKKLTLNQLKQEIWAVYLPTVAQNIALYINGVWVGDGGGFDNPTARHYNEPMYFKFSADLLHLGDNVIDIRVKNTFYTQGILDKLYLAPAEKLNKFYQWKYFWRMSFTQWTTVAMYLMALSLLVFWLARPMDYIYGLFSLELLFWATHNLNLFVTQIPVSTRIWEALNITTLGWTVVAIIFFNHRYLGVVNHKIEKYLIIYAFMGLALFFVPEIKNIFILGYKGWDIIATGLGIYALYFLIQQYQQKKDNDVLLMLLVGIPILVFGLHDILLLNQQNHFDGLIMQYSVIPSIILFGWFLIRRFLQSINKVEQLALTLEKRVKQKQEKLQLQYEKLIKLEKNQVLLQERERIMRDMHDGIGGQLVSAVALLRTYQGEAYQRVRIKIQHSLTDLRLVINSLDPLLNDLSILLGMMRARIHEQLEDANITLKWAVTELPQIETLSPRNSLHIMRIVQEAVTNVIKHSHTKKLTLITGVLNNNTQIFIDIIDHGLGIEELKQQELKTFGRGMGNMHYRAEQIDALLEITNQEIGVRVRLIINVAE